MWQGHRRSHTARPAGPSCARLPPGNLPLGRPPQAPAWPRAFPTRLERGAFSDGGVCPEGASGATTACQAVGLGQNNSLRQLCSGKAPETGGGGLLVQISDTSQLPAQTAGPESNGSVCWGRDLGSHGVGPRRTSPEGRAAALSGLLEKDWWAAKHAQFTPRVWPAVVPHSLWARALPRIWRGGLNQVAENRLLTEESGGGVWHLGHPGASHPRTPVPAGGNSPEPARSGFFWEEHSLPLRGAVYIQKVHWLFVNEYIYTQK